MSITCNDCAGQIGGCLGCNYTGSASERRANMKIAALLGVVCGLASPAGSMSMVSNVTFDDRPTAPPVVLCVPLDPLDALTCAAEAFVPTQPIPVE